MRSDAGNPAIDQAVTMLNRQPQVARIRDIALRVGLSERRFTALFRRQVGLTPKHYARLLRFRAVVDHAHPCRAIDWSAVAADCGYCDQAHLTHEFRRFAGVTPSVFARQRGPHINHLALD